jgi:hypothetical protein
MPEGNLPPLLSEKEIAEKKERISLMLRYRECIDRGITFHPGLTTAGTWILVGTKEGKVSFPFVYSFSSKEECNEFLQMLEEL